jgi:hypothetical protein
MLKLARSAMSYFTGLGHIGVIVEPNEILVL